MLVSDFFLFCCIWYLYCYWHYLRYEKRALLPRLLISSVQWPNVHTLKWKIIMTKVYLKLVHYSEHIIDQLLIIFPILKRWELICVSFTYMKCVRSALHPIPIDDFVTLYEKRNNAPVCNGLQLLQGCLAMAIQQNVFKGSITEL